MNIVPCPLNDDLPSPGNQSGQFFIQSKVQFCYFYYCLIAKYRLHGFCSIGGSQNHKRDPGQRPAFANLFPGHIPVINFGFGILGRTEHVDHKLIKCFEVFPFENFPKFFQDILMLGILQNQPTHPIRAHGCKEPNNTSAVRMTDQKVWSGNTQFIEQNLKVFGGLLAVSRQITDFTFASACSVIRHNRRFRSQVRDD